VKVNCLANPNYSYPKIISRNFGMLNNAIRQCSSYGRKPNNFTGKELDAETGLYYYGARYLDPKTSRWLSGDPALGEYFPVTPVNDEAKKHNGNLPGQGGVFNYVNLHAYHYAGNNPVKYTDPDGRDDEEIDNLKIDALYNIVEDICTKFSDPSEQRKIVNVYNNYEKKSELAAEYAKRYVALRKEKFEIYGDNEDLTKCRDYEMYKELMSNLFSDFVKIYTENYGGDYGAQQTYEGFKNNINNFINPTAAIKYNVDFRKIIALQEKVKRDFFGGKR